MYNDFQFDWQENNFCGRVYLVDHLTELLPLLPVLLDGRQHGLRDGDTLCHSGHSSVHVGNLNSKFKFIQIIISSLQLQTDRKKCGNFTCYGTKKPMSAVLSLCKPTCSLSCLTSHSMAFLLTCSCSARISTIRTRWFNG